jgi:hypothetical protein
MKSSTMILLSTFSVLALVSAGFAEAKAATKKTDASQTASTNYNQAMYQCASNYAGNRGYLGRDRGSYIETCFKSLTGKYPHEVGVNCPLRRC